MTGGEVEKVSQVPRKTEVTGTSDGVGALRVLIFRDKVRENCPLRNAPLLISISEGA